MVWAMNDGGVVSAVVDRVLAVRTAYIDTRSSPRARLPEVLQLPVNDICNSRCEMCFIWEQKRGKELSGQELARVLSDPLFRRVHSVGLNGGEPTLRRDLPELAVAAAESLPELTGVSLITNAIQQRAVLRSIEELRDVTARFGLHFDVMVSLDGVGEVHDRVRGRRGNFESAVEVISEVRSRGLCDSIRVGCTITDTNAMHGQELLDWAIDNDIYARFRVAVSHNRLYNRGRDANYALSDERLFHVLQLLDRLVRDYEPDERRRTFYSSLIDQLAYGQPRRAGCAWRNHGVTLASDGGLAFCAVESPTLGSTLDQPAERLFQRGLPILDEIVADKCAGCLHDYEGPHDFAQELLELVPQRAGARRAVDRSLTIADRVLGRARDAGELVAWVVSNRIPPRSSGSPRDGVFVLTGWYGTETVGDQAILASLLEVVESEHRGRIAVASLEPYVTHRTLRVLGAGDHVDVVRYEEARRLVEAGAAAAVAMAGGPVMGTIPVIRTLASLHRAALRHGVPTGFLGTGIGPLGRFSRRRMIAELLRGATVVTVRDDASRRQVSELVGRSVPVSGDPAALAVPKFVPPPADGSGRPPVMALAIREWPIHEYGGGSVGAEDSNRLVTELRRFVDAARSDWEIHPVAMGYLNEGGDDRRVLRKLLGPVDELTRGVAYPTPASIVAAIRGADVVVAMRYHAALIGVMCGRAVVAIDYTLGGKLAALGDEFPEAVTVLDPRTVTAESLRDAVTAAVREDGAPRAPVAVTSREVLSSAVAQLLRSEELR